MRRIVPIAILAAALVVVVVALWFFFGRASAVPQQPIAFSHNNHARVRQIDCNYCHRNAAVGYLAGLPPLETCMGCHQSIGGSTPPQQAEIQKIRTSFEQQQPVQWTRVTYIPDHVVFAHRPHIRAGVQCTDCHARGAPPEQWFTTFAPGMAWCTTCHSQKNASTECWTCHK